MALVYNSNDDIAAGAFIGCKSPTTRSISI